MTGGPRRPSCGGSGRSPGRSTGRDDKRPGPHNTALPLPERTAKILDTSRRPGNDDNVGLWLDKFVYRNRDDWSIKKEYREYALAQFVRGWRSPLGQAALARRRSALHETHGDPLVCEIHGRVQGRLLVDYGRASAAQAALGFHHTWGVPRISGSAVKGIALMAMREQEATDAEVTAIFGTQPGPDNKLPTNARAGQVLFFDGLPMDGHFALADDVLTPHYGPYYGDDSGAEAPGDWHSPVPYSFLTVVDTTFVFHLAVQPLPGTTLDAARKWLDSARKALTDVFEWHGIGAKTAAGYGRLKEIEPPPDQAVQELAEWLKAQKQAGVPQREQLDQLQSEWGERLKQLKPADLEHAKQCVRKAITSPKLAAVRDEILEEMLKP